MRSLRSSEASEKAALCSRIKASSSSSAVLQSANRRCGEGLGAGVGGDAGADGRLLFGKLVLSGLLGVLRDRGRDRCKALLRRGLLVGLGGKAECLEIGYEDMMVSSSDSDIDMIVLGGSSSRSMLVLNDGGGV